MRSSDLAKRRVHTLIRLAGAAIALLLLSAVVTAAPPPWDFANPGDYSYPATVQITDGTAQLALNPASPPWWDRNWAYRQAISVSNSLATPLPAGSTVKVRLSHAALVSAGKALASGDDVRILYRNTASGTWTELDRVALPGANGWSVASPATTDIWFKTQADIGPNGTMDPNYYVYYGNPAAGNPPATLANVFSQQTAAWPASLPWSAGTFTATQALSNTVQLGPVAQPPRLPNAADSAAYEWKQTASGGGYDPGSGIFTPPPAGDAGWTQVTDATKLGAASSASDGQARWETKVTTGHNQWDWQKVKFHLANTKIQTLNVQWKGWGDPASNYYVYLYLLNPSTSVWEQVKTGWYPSQSAAGTLEINLTDPAVARSYVNSSTGDVWAAIGVKHSNYPPNAVSLVSPLNTTIWDTTIVTLSWSIPAVADQDGDPNISYTVYWRASNGSWNQAGTYGPGTTSVQINTNDNYNTFYWKVTASDGIATQDSAIGTFYTDYTSSGSCPFLLAWNCLEYEYVTDVAGQPLDTPFMKPGLPSAAKNTLPFYLPHLVPLPRLVPDAQNEYRVKLREGQWEIDYADELKLWLVDVPEGYEVRSSTAEDRTKIHARNQLKLFTLKDPHPLRKAVTLDGQDITAALAARDGQTNPASAIPGMVLDFGPIEHPERAKLVLDGWKWTDWAQKIVPGQFQWLAVEVPTQDGGWKQVRRVGPPNAAPDWMVVDLAGAWPTSDHRVRLRNLSTSRITAVFDWVGLDDSEPVEPKITVVSPRLAELSHPGLNTYQKPTAEHPYLVKDDVRRDLPYNWARGKFTRLGDVRPLLESRDDKYVIMQSGDALELVFPNVAPPAPGYHRIPVFFGDLFYKDQPKSPEPLPFHAMTDYPYPATEQYPADAEHRSYQAEWNTREYPGPFVDATQPPAGPAAGQGNLPTQPAAEASPHSANTDYLALTYSIFTSPATYLTQKVSVPSGDQIVAATVSYAVTTPPGTSVTVEASADGGTSWTTVASGDTLYYAPNAANSTLQFRVTLTTMDPLVSPSLTSLTATYYTRTGYVPEPVAGVNPTAETRFVAGSSAITPLNGVRYTSLSSFSATAGSGTPTFQISADNGATWKYWNGSAWAPATDAGTSNTAAVINANLDSFLAQVPIDLTPGVGYGTFKWRAYLTTDGLTSPSLTGVDIGLTADDTVQITAQDVLAGPTVLQDGTTAFAKLTLATNHGGATWTGLNLSALGLASDFAPGGVKVRKDNGDGVFDVNTDTLVGSGSVTGLGDVNMTLSSPQWLTPTGANYWVSFDLTPTAAAGDLVQLALTSSSFVLSSATDTPALAGGTFLAGPATIVDKPDRVTASMTDYAPPVPQTEGYTNVLLGALTLATNTDAAKFTDLTVSLVGAGDADVSSVRLYRSRGMGSPWPADEIGSGTFSGGKITFHIPVSYQDVTTSLRQYPLVVDLAAGSGGRTFHLEVSTAGGIVIAAPDSLADGLPATLSTGSVTVAAPTGTVSFSATDAVTPGDHKYQGTTDVPFLRLRLRANSSTLHWTQLKVARTKLQSFSAVHLYRDDRDNPASFDKMAHATLVGTAPPADPSADKTLIDFTGNPQAITTTDAYFWVTGDLATTGNAGDNVHLSVDANSSLTFLEVGTAVSGTFPATSGSLVVDDTDDAVTQVYQAGAATAPQGSTRVPVLTLALSTVDEAKLTGLDLTLSDTGATAATAADVKSLDLYLDANGNGAYDASTDLALASGIIAWDTRTVHFGPLNLEPWLTSETTKLLVTADLDSEAVVGHVLTVLADSDALVLASPDHADPGAVAWPFETALTVTKRPVEVMVAKGSVSPTGLQGATNVVVGKASLATAESYSQLAKLTVTFSGTGDPAQVTAVKLWRAADDGTFSSEGGNLLATGTFAGTTAILTLGAPLSLGTVPQTIYVTYDFSTTATLGATFGASLADSTAVDVGAVDGVSATGFPMTWSTLTLGRSAKTVNLTTADLAPAVTLPGMTLVPILAFRPSVASDDTVLTQVVVDLTGTGPASEVARVQLWRDAEPGDGAFKPAQDTLVGSVEPSGGRAVIALAAGETIAAGSPAWFFISYDLTSQAAPGGTHGGRLTDASALSFTRSDTADPVAFPASSSLAPVQALSTGIPALPDTTLTINPRVDANAGVGGVQTRLFGEAEAPVTVAITNNGATTSIDVDPVGGVWSFEATWRPGVNEVTVTAGGVTTTFEVDLIDPFGVVYNAATGAPIEGATVTIRRQNGSVFGTQVTLADGQYSFLVPAGTYSLEVTAPSFGSVPPGSTLVSVPAGNGLGTTAGSRDGVYTDIYYGTEFTVALAPLHFDIPLDPVGFQALGLLKTVDRSSASVGDVVTYRLKLTNPGETLSGVTIVDTLPAGLRYLDGTTSVGGAVAPDPAIDRQTLVFTVASVPAGGEAWLSYKVVVDPAAHPGTLTNTAVVRRPNSSAALSNTASASLQVVRDAFFQLSTVLGRVYRDENGNGRPDAGERGWAGVRVVADDGAVITADAEGRFHLAGLSGPSKAFKLDESSLPEGAVLTTPNPVLAALRPGLPAEVEFGVRPGEPGKASAAPAAATTPDSFHLVAGDLRFQGGQSEGRLAAYVNEMVFGKYQYVLSYDSARTRGSQEPLPAEQGYLGYGDQSKVSRQAPQSSTPLYLSVTGPGFQAQWGDFELPAGAGQGGGRQATGASLTLKSGEETREGAARQLTAYAATLAYPKVRDELRAQDGSLYYLSHRPIVASTFRAWLEARDALTGQVATHVELAAGRDFDLDPVGGRIMTRELIPSSVKNGSLLGQPAEADLPVYLVADYQYDSSASFNPSIYGGRGEAQLGTARAGFTLAIGEEGQAAMYSADLTGQAGPFAKYRLEAGWGRANDVTRYGSDDGGVNYQAKAAAPVGGTPTEGGKAALEATIDLGRLAAPLEQSAREGALAKASAALGGGNSAPALRPADAVGGEKASKLQTSIAADLKSYFKAEDFAIGLSAKKASEPEVSLLKTSEVAQSLLRNQNPGILPGWWKQDGALTFEAKVKETTAGFSNGSEPVTADEQQLNYRLQAKLAEGTTVKVGSEATYTPEGGSEKVTGSVHVETAQSGFTAEVGEANTSQGGGPVTTSRTLAAEYQYKVNQTFALTVGRKIDYEQPDLTVNTVGAAAKTDKMSAEAKYSTGEKEKSATASLAYTLRPGARLYTNWEGGERDGADLHRFTVGGSTDVNDRTSVFLERKLDTTSSGFASTDAVGAEFRPQDGLGLSVALGRGLAPNGSERTSSSLGLSYRRDGGALLSTGLELSSQADGRRDVALRGRGELPLSSDLTLLGRVAVSELSGAGYTGGNLGEVAVGAAYRPVDASRMNLLAQVVYRTEDGDPTGNGGDVSAVDSLVLSAEGTYRLGGKWRLGEKVAWKRAAAEADYTDTLLWASRVLYEVEPGIELSGEYRVVKQGDATDAGPVLEADIALPYMEGLTLGVGYNYAGFSDSLLSDSPENGWFLRLRGLF